MCLLYEFFWVRFQDKMLFTEKMFMPPSHPELGKWNLSLQEQILDFGSQVAGVPSCAHSHLLWWLQLPEELQPQWGPRHSPLAFWDLNKKEKDSTTKSKAQKSFVAMSSEGSPNMEFVQPLVYCFFWCIYHIYIYIYIYTKYIYIYIYIYIYQIHIYFFSIRGPVRGPGQNPSTELS
jgi:hypothetical protein